MHPTIQTILMVRDKDLRKWGRPVAVLMFCFAIIVCGLALAFRLLVNDGIAPILRDVTDKESLYLERYSTSENISSIRSVISARRRADESVLAAAKSVSWVLVGAGLLGFGYGVLSWRSYELASLVFPKSSSNKNQIQEAEQDAPSNGDKRPD